jgi:hypothetical protein
MIIMISTAAVVQPIPLLPTMLPISWFSASHMI